VLKGNGRHRTLAVSGCFSIPTSDGIVAEGLGGVPFKANTPFMIRDTWGYAPVGVCGKPELFDLQADPYALSNTISRHEAVAGELHKEFAEYLKRLDASPEFIAKWKTGR